MGTLKYDGEAEDKLNREASQMQDDYRITRRGAMPMRIIPLTIKRANEVVSEYHRHNKPTNGGLFAIGAMHDGELVGAAIVGRPVARHLDNKFTAEVTRTCVMPSAPKNTVSFLYGACRRIAFSMGYEKVITYTLQTESGASLRGAGWQMELELAPRSGWDTPSRRRKAGTVDNVGKRRWCSVAN